MRTLNETLLLAADVSMSETSKVQSLTNIGQAALTAIFTGSPNGTLKLQASCDPDSILASHVSNWVDIPNQSQSVASAGGVIFQLSEIGYNWIRAVWAAGGTGTVTIQINGKGF